MTCHQRPSFMNAMYRPGRRVVHAAPLSHLRAYAATTIHCVLCNLQNPSGGAYPSHHPPMSAQRRIHTTVLAWTGRQRNSSGRSSRPSPECCGVFWQRRAPIVGAQWPLSVVPFMMRLFAARLQSTELPRRCRVVQRTHLRTVDGKLRLCDESGKCCVSRQRPACLINGSLPRPAVCPSRKLPE